jgi:hypothetical protein
MHQGVGSPDRTQDDEDETNQWGQYQKKQGDNNQSPCVKMINCAQVVCGSLV